jgi:mitogen-activated protein kinase organizer 1
MQTLQEARDSITSIAIPSSIPEIVVGCVDGNVRTYDLRMGKQIEDTIGGESL